MSACGKKGKGVNGSSDLFGVRPARTSTFHMLGWFDDKRLFARLIEQHVLGDDVLRAQAIDYIGLSSAW